MSSSPFRHLAGAVRRLSLTALPAALLSAGCGGGSGSTSATSQTAGSSGPAIVAAGGKKTSGGGGAGSGTTATTHTRVTPAGGPTSSGAAHAPATTTTTKASTPAAIHRAAPPAGERLLRSFAGSGNARLGTVVVNSAEELVWQAGRPPIQIFAANGFILVNSQASNGSIHLSRGTYRGVRVATHASWTIELRSRA